MANLEAWSSVPTVGVHPDESGVAELFRARYLEVVRLAGLLGADDPEDVAQEAFTRLMNKEPDLDDPRATVPYLRAIVVNLTRNRHRQLRVARLRAPAAAASAPASCEQAAIAYEDQREVIAALAALPSRRREAIVLRFWLDLPEREIAAAMGVSLGTVKSQLSRGLAALARTLGDRS
jgi:RNA polymerase sigma factor (sigma-70 family)